MARIALLLFLNLFSRIDFIDPALANPLTTQVLIKEGKFEPLYDARAKPLPIKIESYLLDGTPVTNRDYMEFLKFNPSWGKNEIAPLVGNGAAGKSDEQGVFLQLDAVSLLDEGYQFALVVLVWSP